MKLLIQFIPLIYLFNLSLTYSETTSNLSIIEKYNPKEELMIVQSVSIDKKNFVITKGIKDGIFKGQEIIFSSENAALLCKAIEVSREFSLWKPVSKEASIPFKKEQFISFNAYSYGQVAFDIESTSTKINKVPVDINEIYKKFRKNNNYSLKIGMNKGLSQSSSDVSAEKNSSRNGYTITLEYNHRFMPEFEINYGLKIENEVYRITSPELDIPTSRIMATLSATYHLLYFSKNENNFYLTLGLGYGTSKTTVDEVISKGSSALLPEARIGFLMPFSKQTAIFAEGSIESVSTTEKVADEIEQTTNLLNLKFSIGLRF